MTPTTYSYAYHNHENDDNDEWENTKNYKWAERNAERDSANEEFVYWPLLFLHLLFVLFPLRLQLPKLSLSISLSFNDIMAWRAKKLNKLLVISVFTS